MAKIYSTNDGTKQVYYAFKDQAVRAAQSRANHSGGAVEVYTYTVNRPYRSHITMAACLNHDKWYDAVSQQIVQPMTGIKLRNFLKNEAELAEYFKGDAADA